MRKLNKNIRKIVEKQEFSVAFRNFLESSNSDAEAVKMAEAGLLASFEAHKAAVKTGLTRIWARNGNLYETDTKGKTTKIKGILNNKKEILQSKFSLK